MAKKKMYISVILDETGSMQVVKEQTISGFNEYVETLRGEETASIMRFTLTKFNSTKVEIIHDGVRMDAVKSLTDATYQPANLTPLYDAIGRTVRMLEKKVDGQKKATALVVIQTDGQENASKEFTREAIFSLIDEKKGAGWTFVFLGADQDAWAVGQQLGLDQGNVMSYASADTGKTFRETAAGTLSYARSGGLQTDRFFEEDGDTAKWKQS